MSPGLLATLCYLFMLIVLQIVKSPCRCFSHCLRSKHESYIFLFLISAEDGSGRCQHGLNSLLAGALQGPGPVLQVPCPCRGPALLRQAKLAMCLSLRSCFGRPPRPGCWLAWIRACPCAKRRLTHLQVWLHISITLAQDAMITIISDTNAIVTGLPAHHVHLH